MVNLSIDPPPFGRAPAGAGRALARLLTYVVVLAVGIGGGFYLGRKSAPVPPAAAGAEASPAAAAGAAGSAPAAPAVAEKGAAAQPPAAPATPAAPAPAAGQTAAAPAAGAAAAAATPPPAAAVQAGAPQGPLVRRISVVLRGSLEESITAALPANEKSWGEQLTQVTNRILVWSLQIARDGRKGDKLDLLYELPSAQPTETFAVGDAGPVTKEPVVLALRYGSQKLGRLLTAYRFKPEGSAFPHYYASDGTDVEEHLVDSPVDSYEQVTSLLRDGRRHKGVDYKTPVGTPVRAPFDGVVLKRNWNWRANGNCLEIVDSKSGRHVVFLHLEAAPKEMQPGVRVKKGEVIAKSGNSGHSTAPHLHYQLEAADGRVLDPFAVLPTRRVALEGGAKTAFDAERARFDPMLVAGK